MDKQVDRHNFTESSIWDSMNMARLDEIVGPSFSLTQWKAS